MAKEEWSVYHVLGRDDLKGSVKELLAEKEKKKKNPNPNPQTANNKTRKIPR